MQSTLGVVVVCLMLTGISRAASFDFRVKHDHTFGSCEGKLSTNEEGLRYEATNGKHSQTWAYIDVQRLDVASFSRVVFKTFRSQSWKQMKRDKVFEFTLIEGKLTSEEQEFLRARLSRPMVARLVERTDQGSPILLVRHRHRLGGCEGQLTIEEDQLVYRADHSQDNRVWKLIDIETIGSPNPYHLRVTTYNETFTFDLKSSLDPHVYDSLWKKVYHFGNMTRR